MSPQGLLNVLQKRPFESFRIHLSDGTVYDIDHPKLVMPGFTSAVIGIPTDETMPTVYGKMEIVALNHIVRLQPIARKSTSKDGTA